MNIPKCLRFELINGLSKSHLDSNPFKIYLHKCQDGVYVGVSEDPVRRWQEHWIDAHTQESPNYNDKIKRAIRKYRDNFDHYIVAVSKFEKSSRNKEAEAIRYYEANLNVRPEVNLTNHDFGYKPIDDQISLVVILEKNKIEGSHYSREDKSRIPVTAKVIFEGNRKRLISIDNPNFPSGLMIECSRSEREKFEVGDIVSINVALSEKNGKKYLAAAKTGTVIKIEFYD